MQTQHIETELGNENAPFFTVTKKTIRTRKWREIEALKAQQRLIRELKEIDQGFELSASDLL